MKRWGNQSIGIHWRVFIAMLIKHYKVLLQSKSTLFTMILGPLLIVILIGLAFNTTETQQLSVGVYANTTSAIAEDIQRTLAEDFKVDTTQTETECKQKVVNGENQICIVFPKNLDPTREDYDNELVVYADSSQLNLAYIITQELDTSVSVRAENISIEHVNELLRTIQDINTQLNTDKARIQSALQLNQETKTQLEQTSSQAQTQELTYEVPTDILFGSIITELRDSAYTLAGQLGTVDSFQENLRSELNGIEADIASAQAEHDNYCTEVEPEIDCEALEQEITQLEEERQEIQSYISPALDGTLIELAINISLALEEVQPSAQIVDTKLAEAQNKIAQARSSLQSIQANLLSMQTRTNSAHSYLESIVQSQTQQQSSIESLQVTDSARIATPIKTRYEELQNEQGTYINKLFPILLTLFIMLVSILLSSTFVIIEKRSNTFIRNNIAPVYENFFPLTTLLVLLSIVLLESIVLLFIAQIFFGINSVIYFFPLLLAMSALATLFILLGMDIGLLFDTEESVTLISVFITSLMMLFSQLVFPLQSMTEGLSRFAHINPFVIGSDMFKKIILFEAPLSSYSHEYLLLGIYIVMFAATFTIAYKLAVKNY